MSKPLIAIWIEGLRSDQVTKTHTPFLAKLFSQQQMPVTPVYGNLANQAALFTGRYPDKINLLYYYQLNEKIKSSTKYQAIFNKFPQFLSDFIQLAQGKTFLTPKLSFPHHYQIQPTLKQNFHSDNFSFPTLFKLLQKQHSTYLYYDSPLIFISNQKTKTDYLINWSDAIKLNNFHQLLQKHIPDFSLIKLNQHQEICKRHGVKANKVKKHLAKLQSQLERLYNTFSSKAHIVIFSTHGLASVRRQRNLMSVMPVNLKNTHLFIGPTFACFWFNNQREQLDVLDRVSKLKWGSWLSTADKRRLHLDIDDETYGQQIFTLSESNILVPNHLSGKSASKTAWNYPEISSSTQGILFSSYPFKTKQMQTVDIFHLFTHLLGLKTPKTDSKLSF